MKNALAIGGNLLTIKRITSPEERSAINGRLEQLMKAKPVDFFQVVVNG